MIVRIKINYSEGPNCITLFLNCSCVSFWVGWRLNSMLCGGATIARSKYIVECPPGLRSQRLFSQWVTNAPTKTLMKKKQIGPTWNSWTHRGHSSGYQGLVGYQIMKDKDRQSQADGEAKVAEYWDGSLNEYLLGKNLTKLSLLWMVVNPFLSPQI